jgi:hypothetical protein
VPDISKKTRIEKGTVIQNITYKNKLGIDIFNSTLRKIYKEIIRKMEKKNKGEEEINNKSYSKFTYVGSMKEHKYEYSFQVRTNTIGSSLRNKNELKFRSDIMEPSNCNVLRVEECIGVTFADCLRHDLKRRATRVS